MINVDLQKRLEGSDGVLSLHFQAEITAGSFITLYGPSGAGKTSILRMLAGLMEPDAGKISVDSEVWYDPNSRTNLPPQRRNIGYVFQDYALFPHLSVRENLEFALADKKDIGVVEELMEITELGELQSRRPDTLSGGHQQRVALARSLVRKPKILLLDEPLAALDHKIRLKMQDYLLELHREFGLTTLLVSHDIGEISKLSDHVFQLDKGEVIKSGTPSEIFTSQNISGKFKFVGEVLRIEVQDMVSIVTVLIQNQVVKVIATEDESRGIDVGSKVIIASKAFNPVIYRIE